MSEGNNSALPAGAEPDSVVPPPASGAGGETVAVAKPKVAGGARFRLETARVDPTLAEQRLAAYWQRLVAIVIDVVVVAALSVLSGPLLAMGTGATIASLGGRDVSPTKAWAVVRWVFIALGAGVMVASVFLMAGRPLVRAGAFNLAAVSRPAPELTEYEMPLVPGKEDYRRANVQLAANVATLKAENAQLRASLRGSSWLNAASDFSRTLGLTFGWGGVYFTLCLAWWRGRTLGKWLVGTRVVRLDGRPLTTLDAFTRYGGYAAGFATGFIGFARLLWEPNRQAIEDKIAWTVVLRGR